MSNVPRLRFSDYNKQWKEKKISQLSDSIVAGGTPSTTIPEYWNGNIRWMSSGELNHKKIFNVEKTITELGLKKSSTKIIPKKSVLIGLAGQGKTRGTVAINMIDLCINQSIAAIFPNKDKFIPEFLYHNLDHRYNELRRLSTGEGGRGGLNLGIIKSIKVWLPEQQEEQEKIASFLSSIDGRIEQLTKYEELLQLYKKGVMQQLFKQKIRFKKDDGSSFENWKNKKLSKLMYEHKERNYNKRYTKNDVLSVSGKYGIVNQIELQGRSFAGASVDNYHIVKINVLSILKVL
jgi:type I restriction enzyme, S subunit